MSNLDYTSLSAFSEAVLLGSAEAAAAFSRTFDTEIMIQPSDGGKLDSSFSSKIQGKGLVLVLWCAGKGIGIFIPSSTGLVPIWSNHPDATGKSKLSTFAQEWGLNLIPESFFPEDFKAVVVEDMSHSFAQARPDYNGGFLSVVVTKTNGSKENIYLAWPFEEPEELLKSPDDMHEKENIPGPPTFMQNVPTFTNNAPTFIGQGAPGFDPFDSHGSSQKRASMDDLPGYARSVLKTQVPVAAVLVRARKSIKLILELGVGSVIQFDKSCDQLLEVEVGQKVVIGMAEAVKVGDKFGFRINSILLPEERFRRVEIRRDGEYRVKKDAPQIIGKAPIKSMDKRN